VNPDTADWAVLEAWPGGKGRKQQDRSQTPTLQERHDETPSMDFRWIMLAFGDNGVWGVCSWKEPLRGDTLGQRFLVCDLVLLLFWGYGPLFYFDLHFDPPTFGCTLPQSKHDMGKFSHAFNS